MKGWTYENLSTTTMHIETKKRYAARACLEKYILDNESLMINIKSLSVTGKLTMTNKER